MLLLFSFSDGMVAEYDPFVDRRISRITSSLLSPALYAEIKIFLRIRSYADRAGFRITGEFSLPR